MFSGIAKICSLTTALSEPYNLLCALYCAVFYGPFILFCGAIFEESPYQLRFKSHGTKDTGHYNPERSKFFLLQPHLGSFSCFFSRPRLALSSKPNSGPNPHGTPRLGNSPSSPSSRTAMSARIASPPFSIVSGVSWNSIKHFLKNL